MPKQPTISRAELVRVLTEAALFADKSGRIPVLNTVRLEAIGTHLVAAATDRFTLGASSADYEGTPFAINLPLHAVALILTACKLGKTDRRTDVVDLRVTPKGTLLHVTLGETVLTVPTFDTGAGGYPDWRKFVGDSTTDVDDVAGTIGINPKYLARFAKVGHQAKFYLRGPSKPVTVRVGDHFIGAVMPIRLTDDTPKVWALPGWLETSTAAVKAAA